MASLDTVSIGILFGALLVLAGILSSLVALRFGAPLLLVFLIFGMLAGEEGPGGARGVDEDVAAARDMKNAKTRYVTACNTVAVALVMFGRRPADAPSLSLPRLP